MSVDWSIFQPLLDDPEFQRLAEGVRRGSPASVAGLVESSKALVLYLLRSLTGRPIMLVVPDEARLEEYDRDLKAFGRLLGGLPPSVMGSGAGAAHAGPAHGPAGGAAGQGRGSSAASGAAGPAAPKAGSASARLGGTSASGRDGEPTPPSVGGSPVSGVRVLRLPALGADPYQGIPPHFRTSFERVTALAAVVSGDWDFLLVPARALTTPVPAPEVFSGLRTRVRTSAPLELQRFLASIIAGGYRREELVGEEGEFSQRGGIVDIFPPGTEHPVRIELEGDDVASIRSFDADTQRSVDRLESVDILPVVEAPLRTEERERLAIAASIWRDRLAPGPEARHWMERLDRLEAGEHVPGVEALIRMFQPGSTDLTAYLRGALRAVDEPDRSAEEVLSAVAEMEASRRASPGCPLPPAGEIFLDPAATIAQLKRSDLRLSELRVGGEASAAFSSQSARNFGGRVLDFIREIGVHRQAGRRVAVFMSTLGTRERLGDILGEYGITFRVVTPGDPSVASPVAAAAARPPVGRPGTGRGVIRSGLDSVQRAESIDEGEADRIEPHDRAGRGLRRGQSYSRVDRIERDDRNGSADRSELDDLYDPADGNDRDDQDDRNELGDRNGPGDRGDEGEIDPDLVGGPIRPQDWAKWAAARPGSSGSPDVPGTPGLPATPDRAFPEIPPGEPVILVDCHLNYGFVLTEIGLAIVTEREIFGEEARPSAAVKRRKGAAFISDFRDLRVGDLVVHVDHGVGRYLGLARPPGSPRDFMLVQYAEDSRLYVPVDRLDLVQKYGGAEGERRTLDKLGGPGWERVKSRVKKAIRDMTKELLDLYAKRKVIPGRAFSPDTPWQREFEDAFPYVLTPDQEHAIADVRADMESGKAMERLLCGDVGYGKTEVAMRAAFKAVQDGTQVAILAPTTVLALQHWRTFRERFAAFPVSIEMVSRLRSPREQKEALDKLAEGKVDILIGTHRLLSKDVRFKDLGLLVVDEEQRFGVAHKEKLKQITAGIDTLSMSATPIPRTLQMSLAGVRDLSVIETPPMNRLAIQTNLIPYSRGTIAAAIRSELRRGGQVYFVHNRVQSIHRVAARIQAIVPEARLGVTHGQMDPKSLEETMVRFLRGEFDLLVSTTIIENGLDIPRVNTLIVNRADRMGLSQLYQLRGRVGRSDVRAYSYFIVPSRRTLTPIARRRLLALQEFSDLGAGFRIAALDLELRGAGDLLGARQHGHIAALGFDLYLKMLEEAVHEYQGQAPEPEAATFNLGVDIRLPDVYIPEPNLRLALYKRIASSAGPEELSEIRAEIEDRYGKLPGPGENLFAIAGLKIEAGRLGIKSVEFAEGRLSFRFHEKPPVSPERVISFLGKQGFATLTPTGVLKVPAPPAAPARIEAARTVLKALAS